MTIAARRSHVVALPARLAFFALLALVALIPAAALAQSWWSSVPSSSATIYFPEDGRPAMPFKAGNIEGWLVRQPDGHIDAFSARSPAWQGCPVELGNAPRVGPYFHDCFTNFDMTGRRLAGPAPRDLDRFEIAHINGSYVTLRDITRVVVAGCPPAADPQQEHCASALPPQYAPARPPTRARSGAPW